MASTVNYIIIILVFSSCTFHTVGTAAGEQKFNSVCILSLNIINEKVINLSDYFYIIVVQIDCLR